MQVFLAVIDDLFQFARISLFGVFVENNFVQKSSIHAVTKQIDSRSFGESDCEVREEHQRSKALPLLLQGALYFIQSKSASLYVDPVVAFDSAIVNLAYGQQVHVLKFGGRWAQVSCDGEEGWVLKDFLSEKAVDVFPVFTQAESYAADNTETQKTRMCIDDMFGGAICEAPLFDVEYVSYKLFKKGRQIDWPSTRPRIAGTWQKKLRGRRGIYNGIAPKTDSVMEYIVEDQGHVCFVEAVFPDESIKLSGVGIEQESIYSEKTMLREEWKELRPIFIEVM